MTNHSSVLYEDKDTDPRIQFYEFVLICGWMAIHSMKNLHTVKDWVVHFFTDKLKFQKVIFGRLYDYTELWESVK